MSLHSRDPILLTPGPLTTSLPTKMAMLRDWGSWDAAFNAVTAGVPVIGEVELASRFLSGRIIAITGTKGKSTTTTLAARSRSRR